MQVFEFVLIDEHSKISLMAGDKDRFDSPADFLEEVLGQGFQRKRGSYPGVELFVSNQNRENLTPNLIGSFIAEFMPVKGPVLILAKNCGRIPKKLIDSLDKVIEEFIKLRKQGKTLKPVGADEWLEVQHLTMS